MTSTEDTQSGWPSAEPQHAAAEETQTENVTSVDTAEPVKVGEEVTTPQEQSDEEGVQVGGLTYTQNEDGTRDYPAQDKNVDVTVEPAE